jgi:hypothetical protein
MVNEHVWKVWLTPNLLTQEVENDYVAEVSTVGKTLHNEDVARLIKNEGSELEYETILDVFNHGDRLRRGLLQQGYSIQTGVCRVSPRVPGNWIGSAARYDPKKHRRVCDLTMTAELRHDLEEVGVEVLGVKDSGARVGLVTDVITGLTDGTITPDGDIIIEGEKIRIFPHDEAGLGVYLVDAGGSETLVNPPYPVNDPKKIICRVPPVGAGDYTLRIITRFSNSNVKLQHPRVIDYELALKVL